MRNCVFWGRCPNFFRINLWSSVIILPVLTMDFLGKPADSCSSGERIYSSSAISAILFGICEVIAARIISVFLLLYQSDEITRAGLCLEADKLVKGNPTNTTSSLLKSVINGIFFVFPELKRFFCEFQKFKVFNFNFQNVRKIYE